MRKTEFQLPTSGKWGSLVTKYSPLSNYVTPDSFTANSGDFYTHLSGNIEKRWTDLQYNSTSLAGLLNDQFEMVFSSGVRHMLLRNNTALSFTAGNNQVYPVYQPFNAAGNIEYTSYLDICYMDNAIDNPVAYDLTGVYGGVTYLPLEVIITAFAGLSGKTFTIGGAALVEGVNWTAGTSNDATATSLAAAINAISLSPYVAVASTSTITITLATPTYTVSALFSSGATGYTISPINFPRVKPMGCQTPASAVTFAANTAGGNVPDGDHTYIVTYLYYGFEESNGGPASSAHTVSSTNQTVHLTAVPRGGYGVTARNIYRDNNDGAWSLVGTILDNTTTTFTDTALVGTTNLQIINGLPPTFGLCTQWLSRTFVAKVPGELSTLYWSMPGEPDNWDPSNFIVCNPADTIQALVVYQGILFVLNQYSIGYISGNTDSTFAYVPIPSANVGCVDNRSVQIRVVDGLPLLIFLSAKGLYACNGTSIQYISDAIEPDLNLNLTQSNLQNGSSTQRSLADWNSGTSSPGIDLVSNPGVLQTINPTASYTTEANWVTGTLTNLATEDGTATLKVPTQFSPTLASGTETVNATLISGIPTSITNTTSAWLNLGSQTNINTSTAVGAIQRDWFLISDFHAGNSNPTWGGTTSGSASWSITSGSPGHIDGFQSGSGNPYAVTSTAVANPAFGTWSFKVNSMSNAVGGGGAAGRVMVYFACTGFDSFGQPSGGYWISFDGAFGTSFGVNSTTLLGLSGTTGTWVISRDSSNKWTIQLDGVVLGTVFNGTVSTSSYWAMLTFPTGFVPGASTCQLTNFYYSTAYHTTSVTPSNAQAVEIVTIDQLVTPFAEGLITYTPTTPAGTSVEVNTATSPDNITYSGYSALGLGGAIASTPNRYLRVQFILHCPVDSGTTEANLNGSAVTNIAATWTPDPMVSLTINGSGSATSGTWVSPTYDTFSLGHVSTGMSLAFTASYPANTGSTITVDGANDPFFATIVTTQSFSSPTSGSSLTTSGARYWRVTYALASTNGVYTPLISPCVLSFNTTGTWLSPVITTTLDAASFASLVTSDTTPAGTGVTTTIATSADGVTWSSFTALGSAVPSKFAQIKCQLTSSDPTATAIVSSIIFDWNLASTFVSQGIDTTGTPPAGYGLFTAVDFANGGTIIFSFRTASTLVGLNSASFITVTPGTIPSNTVLQYIQWKAALTSTANAVPQIDSVTSRWLIGNITPSARVASLFFDKTYYLFAAQVGNTNNNICFVLDYQGNWREFKNITVASIGTFFAVPYYLDAVRNNIYQWQVLLNGIGTIPFTMDVRTKDFDLSDLGTLKNVRALWVRGYNTGTTINAFYSADNGNTWVPMLNTLTGVSGYTSSANGKVFNAYFIPDYSLYTNVVEGVSLMFRVTSSDSFPCELISLRPVIYGRAGKYIGEAT